MTTELSTILEQLRDMLARSEVPFMVAGSFASTVHGIPRTTHDLDIVIDPPDRDALVRLLDALAPERFYFDREAAFDALARRSMFNVIDIASAWKIDFILRKNRPFSRSEFGRRSPSELLGVRVDVATAEDTVIAKLEWSKTSGGSERQRRDVAGILATTGDLLDRAYIERWVDALDLVDEWRAAYAMPPT